jgi:hypothetical protein
MTIDSKWTRSDGRCSVCEEYNVPVIEVCASSVGAGEWWLCVSCLDGYRVELRRRIAGYVEIRCERCESSHLVPPLHSPACVPVHLCGCGVALSVFDLLTSGRP